MLVVTLLLSAHAASPIAKVVELINDLSVKVKLDGKNEQTVYDKYACWCQETMTKKVTAIGDAKESISVLSKKIKEASGRLGSFGAEIAKLKKDIAENKEFTTTTDELRSKEHGAFKAKESALQQGIANLKKAIDVLTAGTTGQSAAMVEMNMLTVAAGVRSAIKVYSKRADADSDAVDTVKSFLSNPVSLVASRANPATQTYQHQSGAIQGILAQMLDDFNSDLESSTQEENQRKSDYDDMKANKAHELQMLEDTLVKKNSQNGGDAKSLAENKVEREETRKQLKIDEEFLETTTDNCRAEADAWATRSRLRTEELAGMQQAVEILTSGDASTTFADSESTFVQLGAHATERAKAYNEIKAAARATHSARLAAVAARVYMGGHFDAVIASVQTQIDNLRKEEKADEDHKNWCDLERSNALSKKENLEYDQSELNNKLGRLADTKQDHEASIGKLATEMGELEQAMKEALDNRNAEKEAFKKAMKDDTDAVILISKAMEALSRFYEKNGLALSQKKTHHRKKQPEYKASADTAPTSVSAGGEYGGRSSENAGVVGLLEGIKEDTENEMQVAREEEQSAAGAYRTQTEQARQSMRAMEDKVTSLKGRIADALKESADTQSVHDGKQKSWDAADAYLTDLKPSCDWVDRTFKSRREARKTEIEGLQQAKGTLAGAAPGLLTVRSRSSKAAQLDSDMEDLDDIERSMSFLQRRH